MTRDEVIQALEHEIARADYADIDWLDCVEVAPLRDALALLKAEPKRGVWLPVADYCYDDQPAWDCSECEAMVQRPYNYCPRCGAKMEEEGDTKCET